MHFLCKSCVCACMCVRSPTYVCACARVPAFLCVCLLYLAHLLSLARLPRRPGWSSTHPQPDRLRLAHHSYLLPLPAPSTLARCHARFKAPLALANAALRTTL